jgi:hypothetical protein
MTETNSTSNTNFNIPSSKLPQLNQNMNEYKKQLLLHEKAEKNKIKACINNCD